MSRMDKYSDYGHNSEPCCEAEKTPEIVKLTEKLQGTRDRLLKSLDILYGIKGKIFGTPCPALEGDNGQMSVDYLIDRIGLIANELLGNVDEITKRL